MNLWRNLLQIVPIILMLFIFSLPAAPLLRPLTPDQGLTQGSVNDFLIDHEGFLWLATAGGLNRFDGNQVVQISTPQHGLKEVAFTKLLLDSDKQILATSENGDVYRYLPQTGHVELFTSLRQHTERQNSIYISSITQLNEQFLLVTTDHSVYSVSRKDGYSVKLFDIKDAGFPEGWLRTTFAYQDYLFIGAFNGVVAYHLPDGKYKYLPYLQIENPTTDQLHAKFLDVYQEKLWIGTVEGLYSIPVNDVLAFLQHEAPFNVTTEVAFRNIWKVLWQGETALIGTEIGLYQFNTIDRQYQQLFKFSDATLNLFDNTITDIETDKTGGVWLASRDDGAFYWHPRSAAFKQITRTEEAGRNLSNDKVYALLPDGDDILWVGTTNGLNKLNLNTGSVKSYFVSDNPKDIEHDGTIYAIMPYKKNQLLIHASTGLKLFDTKQEKLLPLPLANESDSRYLGHEMYYVYPYKDALYFLYRTQLIRYDIATGQVQDVSAEIASLGLDDYGTIVGHVDGPNAGLLLSKPDELWLWQPELKRTQLLYRAPELLPELGRTAETAVTDKHGTLWVGMAGIGLLAFDINTLTLKHLFDAKNSPVSDAIYGLTLDKNGNIWFSSHKGLARVNPVTLQIEFFSNDDGVHTHEFNGGASARLPDGQLAFGSMRGVTLVKPDILEKAEKAPTVLITGISLLSGDFKPLNANLNDREFTLSHSDLGITLTFSAMSFNNNHKIRYRYWLEGSSNVAYPVQQNNSVVFPQLRAGEYRFNVVSIAPDTGKESAPATLTLTVKPAPWLSNWALTSYGFFAAAILLLLYRNRRRQQQIIKQAHLKVKTSEQRLKQALASVNSGAWEWLASNDTLFASRINLMLGYHENMNLLTLQQHLSLVHPDDRAQFEKLWQRFLEHPEQGFDCTYRLQHRSGHWLWFRDQGKAVDPDEKQVSRVIGTFSNITETRANEEKARLFGEAFQQTRDWVVILDAKQRVIAANQSFASAFGNMEQYLDQPRPHHLGISLVRRRFYTRLLYEMHPGQHWQGEEQVITPDGRERPTLINISAIGEQQQISFFVLVFTDITAQKLAEDELRYLANYDALTGLPNRSLLMDRIYHGIEQARRDKRSLSLCFIDLDKFKQINDSLGHDVGDLLLKEVARRLVLTLRESDTVARLGGDEFVVLLEGYKSDDNISHVARKMLTVISEPMQLGPHTVGVSPSIGIAVFPADAINATELLKHADVAMYHAKEAGRNNFQFFTAEMNEKAHMQLARETRLRKALQNDEFINFYQPIIDTQKQQLVGAEVLLRWQTSDGMVSPAEFIPLAEDLRLIIRMTHELLERALADLQHWYEQGYQLFLSVNLSTQHLEQPVLAEHICQLLQKYKLPASCLRLEVTESALMRDHQSAIETMLALNKLGVQLALDDFGTGYSSLKYLKELPIDGIKIDRSFVQDIGIDSSDETIIEAMLSMADSLGMYCIAEGVETEQQLAFFSARRCHLIQGFLFAKPMPADAVLSLLRGNQFNIARH